VDVVFLGYSKRIEETNRHQYIIFSLHVAGFEIRSIERHPTEGAEKGYSHNTSCQSRAESLLIVAAVADTAAGEAALSAKDASCLLRRLAGTGILMFLNTRFVRWEVSAR
jgi:hypothetical protein